MKYSVVRKRGRDWALCSIYTENGKLVEGGKTSDKAVAKHSRDVLAKTYPDIVYAILELEK